MPFLDLQPSAAAYTAATAVYVIETDSHKLLMPQQVQRTALEGSIIEAGSCDQWFRVRVAAAALHPQQASLHGRIQQRNLSLWQTSVPLRGTWRKSCSSCTVSH